ncbi:glycosyltransferase involved in cell wall biosynthesis/O-antigen/teichoic acid export membrane protein [Kitasatospora sp. MAA4]|uniref:glycosyltransferase n=1 Tax=Kitasatospora sp. MAA4 TaxID=3035093 RepID=UPI002474EB41|nr:glycosyltransferase [Kitasatospora sp. MAA4]MDH6137104.1 glycosyltransferase involved in cell wall biosynthesis/O-antigen/teichoic acid export membrane protein [Kitasatospora sp. MAA4]
MTARTGPRRTRAAAPAPTLPDPATAEQPAAVPQHRGEEARALDGARWFAAAYLAVGALNYGYALVLTHLLAPGAFARFAAGQSLLLCASAVSVVAVPWVLAQELARSRTEEQRRDAVSFAVCTSVAGGLVSALVVGAVAAQFAGPITATILAVVTLLIYVTRVTVGWLQGNERLRPMAGVAVAEAALKVGAGLLLVVLAHLTDAGALAAFGAGLLPYVLYWPRRRAGELRRSWRRLLSHRALWRRAAGIACLQGLVAVLAAADLVLVAMLSHSSAQAAGYQAAAALGRTPYFVAGAVAMAFFPVLSRRAAGTPLAARAVQMYTRVTLPLVAICATVPPAVIATVFPGSLASAGPVMPWAAVTGFALGAISLAVLFFQAVDDYAIRRLLGLGVVIQSAALLTGWRIGGVRGLAAGASCGLLIVAALVVHRLVRCHGAHVMALVPRVWPLVLVAALILLRPHPVLWAAASVLVGAHAVTRFLTDRHLDHGRARVVISTYDDALNPAYRGGGAVVIDHIAKRLAQHLDVTVLTAGHRGTQRTPDGVTHRRLPLSWAGPRVGQLLFQAALPVMARRLRHDLWLESFTPPFSAALLPLFTRAPVIGLDQVRSGRAMWHKYHVPFFLAERLSFRCYRDLITLNDADAAELRRYSPRARVHVIANGVEDRPQPPQPLGGGRFILFLGRIDTWQKGLDLLLPAYQQAAPDLPLVLAGSGTDAEEQRLRRLLQQHGREVTWLGHIEDEHKDQIMRESAFMVMPSRHETFGLVALESMAYGKPVLHFDLPCLRWMAGHGDVSVPSFDVAALAGGIDHLVRDENNRARLGLQAHQASRRHTWGAVTQCYLELVQNRLATAAGDTDAITGTHAPADPKMIRTI